MDTKLAWGFSSGFFIILMLFNYGEKRDAIGMAILLFSLFIFTLYIQFQKSRPPKIDSDKCKWEQLGLVKNGKYPVYESTRSSPQIEVYSIPLGLGLQDFLNKQTQLETFFHHPIQINVRHIAGESLLEVTLLE